MLFGPTTWWITQFHLPPQVLIPTALGHWDKYIFQENMKTGPDICVKRTQHLASNTHKWEIEVSWVANPAVLPSVAIGRVEFPTGESKTRDGYTGTRTPDPSITPAKPARALMGNLCLPSLHAAESAHLSIVPRTTHSATVIWLHGLGDSGHPWHTRVLDAKPLPGVKYIFPSASFRRVTVNGGMMMPAWFDVYGLRPEDKEDEAGIDRSGRVVADLVQAEVEAGISSTNIFLVGFSQGGAVAVHAAYRLLPSLQLGGVVLLSSYLPLASTFAVKGNNSQKTPAMFCHGDRDMLIPPSYAQKSTDALCNAGVTASIRMYKSVGHAVSECEMDDVRQFVHTRLVAAAK
ncbi:Aste57867_22002 [Aphanomyces stellatus]|uniref:Aste57867_22002 protein n=1 Tax=Aphanomyces stellatus TaxID=120398 RepID=A0A485LJ34_9STRA|nr:hypothetical protein As57867_021933 [Aphanomyces stellatus]VFT98670.1 Aste57867_22002 [Aphanomyces stellatus]